MSTSNKEKNAQIKATLLATRERRNLQKCFVFSTKICYNKLNNQQKEQLQMLFVEAKRFYNDALSYLDINKTLKEYNNKKTTVQIKQKDGTIIEKELNYLTSSIKDSIITKIKNSLSSLHAKKVKGYKVGKLKYKSSYNSIELKQFNNTHRIKNLKRVSIQGIKGYFRVRGLDQFYTIPDIEVANAKLLKKSDGYYIHWTTYIFKDKIPCIKRNEELLGIDFGCGTSFTFSDGRKLDFKLKEPECINKLQHILARKRKFENNKKHSNQYKITQKKLNKKYQKLSNKKNDLANKLCNSLLPYKQIVIQDENLVGWKKSGHGKAVQHSILGRVKSKLKNMSNVTVLSRLAPTTKMCFNCGEIYKEITIKDRVFKCNCGVCLDRDIHAAQCMVWMYQNNFMIKEKEETNSNKSTNKKRSVSSKNKEGLKIPTEHRNKMLVED